MKPRQLDVMVQGDSSNAVFFPLGEMPVLYQEYAAMERDLAVTEEVYSYLLKRYEEAGVDRARNTPTAQVVETHNTGASQRHRPLRSQGTGSR